MKILLLIPLLIIITISALLTGCGFTKGNYPKSVEHAVSASEERYGIELKIKRKAFFPGGAGCDVFCTCKSLPGKEIRVYGMDQRPSHMLVCCDYIYQKYGDDFYRLTADTVHSVYPNHIVNMHENTYNHFPLRDYDRNTAFEDYIADNAMVVYDIIPEPLEKDEALSCYRRIKSLLSDKGINVVLKVYCLKSKEAAETVKVCDYIEDSQSFEYPKTENTHCFVEEINGTPVAKVL